MGRQQAEHYYVCPICGKDMIETRTTIVCSNTDCSYFLVKAEDS